MAEDKKIVSVKEISAGYAGKRQLITDGYQGGDWAKKGYQPTAEVPVNLQPPNVGSAAVIPSVNQVPAAPSANASDGKKTE